MCSNKVLTINPLKACSLLKREVLPGKKVGVVRAFLNR